jgi:hypothetical protein
VETPGIDDTAVYTSLPVATSASSWGKLRRLTGELYRSRRDAHRSTGYRLGCPRRRLRGSLDVFRARNLLARHVVNDAAHRPHRRSRLASADRLLYVQEPGVAEANLEANVTVR